LDDSESHGFHIHSDEVSASSNNQEIANTQISDQPIVGAIITVANGIKVSKADDIADNLAMLVVLFTIVLFTIVLFTIVLFTIVLIVFSKLSSLKPSFLQVVKYRHTP
jgi:hypothetical protein